MARIKITGYLDTDGLPSEYVDLNHKSGLSEEGYLEVVVGEGGRPLTLDGLEDIETELAGE